MTCSGIEWAVLGFFTALIIVVVGVWVHDIKRG